MPDPYRIDGQWQWFWKSENVYDTADVRVYYRMAFWDPLQDGKYQERRCVEVGRNGYRHEFGVLADVFDRVQKYPDSVLGWWSAIIYPMEWYVRPDGASWTLFRAMMPGPMLRWHEEEASFDWVLQPETDSVCGLLCQKAETEYKGREYEAWYCPGIPVDAGPYKFKGLPGLIAKVKDKAGDYEWEMVGLEKGEWPLSEKQFVFQEVSRGKARKFITDMFAHPYAYYGMFANITMVSELEGKRPADDREYGISLFYTPIELE